MTENELILRAQRGDREAIQTLYSRHSPRVYAVVRRLASDDAQAEDWAQEAWVRALRALPSFRAEAQFSTWIHRIAVNCALHARRTRRRREEHETALPLPVSVGGGGERTVLRVRLERALERLPERMRQVLVLHDVEGYTHEEIGAMLGVVAGTCKSQLFKARARMRELLRPAAEPKREETTCGI